MLQRGFSIHQTGWNCTKKHVRDEFFSVLGARVFTKNFPFPASPQASVCSAAQVLQLLLVPVRDSAEQRGTTSTFPFICSLVPLWQLPHEFPCCYPLKQVKKNCSVKIGKAQNLSVSKHLLGRGEAPQVMHEILNLLLAALCTRCTHWGQQIPAPEPRVTHPPGESLTHAISVLEN